MWMPLPDPIHGMGPAPCSRCGGSGGGPDPAQRCPHCLGDGCEPEKAGHGLIIDSLRDLSARCYCGKWTILSPTFDRDSDDYIRRRAQEAFEAHYRYHTAQFDTDR